MNFKRYKKILIGSMSVVALLVVSMAKTPQVYANEAAGKVKDETITSRVIPYYAASTTVGYDVGSDYVDITLWIDSHKGGSEYSSLGYCDFYVDGWAEDSWGFQHDYAGQAHQTSSCGFYAKDPAMQTIRRVHAEGSVCSDDGDIDFNLTRHALDMD